MRVGNDVIDFSEHEMSDFRLAGALRKISHPEELKALGPLVNACSGLEIYWRLWSAKETAYKIVSKRWPLLRFNPTQYRVVDWCRSGDGEYGRVITSRESGLSVELKWEPLDRGLHCVGADDPHWRSLARWKVSDDTGIHSRGLASVLAEEIGFSRSRIIRMPCGDGALGPPRVYFESGAVVGGVDVSLSGHGRYSAAVLLRSEVTPLSEHPTISREAEPLLDWPDLP